jgi:hypothetical protein
VSIKHQTRSRVTWALRCLLVQFTPTPVTLALDFLSHHKYGLYPLKFGFIFQYICHSSCLELDLAGITLMNQPTVQHRTLRQIRAGQYPANTRCIGQKRPDQYLAKMGCIGRILEHILAKYWPSCFCHSVTDFTHTQITIQIIQVVLQHNSKEL